MKPPLYFLLSALLLCLPASARAQEKNAGDFVRRFYEGSRQFTNRFDAYVDSVNLEFAEYLARNWDTFRVEAPHVHPRKPAPKEMPVYIPNQDAPSADTPITVKPEPDSIFVETPAPVRKEQMQTAVEQESSGAPAIEFFGTPVRIHSVEGYETQLSGTGERQIANYWAKLAKTNYKAFIDDLYRKKNTLELGSWGLYRLLCEWADARFAPRSENEKAVFTVYMLNQAGYKAKIGRMQNTLVVMMAFRHMIYGKNYVRFGDDSYYILSEHTPAEGLAVSSYKLHYASAASYVDLRIRTLPKLAGNVRTTKRTYKDKAYSFQCDNNLANYFNTFPQTELAIYAATPLSTVAAESLKAGLAQEMQHKSLTEKLKFLLAFVQYGFAYKTDEEQFGREKFFFPEETLALPYSDCEDRAALFCRMVRMFCGLDTLLIEYPTHVATAVKLDEPGDAIVYNNERYIVCDPTYIGAPIARTMTGYNNATAKIIVPNY
ncbi:MAG: hypothetical protein LBB84_06770 [Tannerellaceae bacterium]|jgi:hypothetical protein|nr:hypothetical protein [Tannerellaceae bacterium]